MRSFAVCSHSFSVSAALAVALAACTVPGASAATPGDAGSSSSTPSASLFRVDTALVAPLQDVQYRTEGISSSSVDDERLNLSPEGLIGSGSGQPPPGRRRSYGKSRYQDRLHNSDGSSRIAFVAGAGASVPVGNTGKYYTLSYGFEAGAGINFNKTFGVLGEFHYDHMGLTGGNIANQYNIYLQSNAASALQGLDANAHVISLTVNPIVNVGGGEHSKFGAYATGGVGYYRKSTNFTLPVVSQDFYTGQIYEQNVNAVTYSANSFGANLGIGLTYKLSEFSSERLFAEGRYNWLKISSENNPDDYIYNRRNTEFIPVMVGIRF